MLKGNHNQLGLQFRDLTCQMRQAGNSTCLQSSICLNLLCQLWLLWDSIFFFFFFLDNDPLGHGSRSGIKNDVTWGTQLQLLKQVNWSTPFFPFFLLLVTLCYDDYELYFIFVWE